MARYQLFPAAEKDLENIWHYTASEWGIDQAASYIDEMAHTFQLLADSPMICRERLEFIPPVRIHNHAAHLIVYAIKGDGIIIVRVLHNSMDIPEQIDEAPL